MALKVVSISDLKKRLGCFRACSALTYISGGLKSAHIITFMVGAGYNTHTGYSSKINIKTVITTVIVSKLYLNNSNKDA